MKLVKWIDAAISLILIIYFRHSYYGSIDGLIEACFITGLYQTTSMAIHAWQGWFTRKGSVRYVYHWIAFISWITIPVGSYWILGTLAPFMAIFYVCLCIYECFKRVRRPLSVLK